MAIEILEYQTEDGDRPFATWFEELNPKAAAKVTSAVTRLGLGNTSQVKGVGSGVLELRLNFGPGYRIYFGKHGQDVVILLGGGTKKRQSEDIAEAQDRWLDYKTRTKAKA